MNAVRAQSGNGPAAASEADYIALVDSEEIESWNAAKKPLAVAEVHGLGPEWEVAKEHALLGELPKAVGGAVLVLEAVALAEAICSEFGEHQLDGGAVEVWEGCELVGKLLNAGEGTLALFEDG
jgi:hypothetical protein